MNEYVPNRYKIMQKIGEGVHGVVLKAIDTTENNKTVAIKMVSLRTKFGGLLSNQRLQEVASKTFLPGISPNTLREIKSLQHADSEYVKRIRNVACYPTSNLINVSDHLAA